VAAAHATIDILEQDGVPKRFLELGALLADGVHSLRGEPNVIDVRNYAGAAAVELAPLPGTPGLRAIRLFEDALKRGVLVRFTGDTIALAPPVISTEAEIQRLVETMREAIRAVA
jgi:beta-alanine--pyruvate transaminase